MSKSPGNIKHQRDRFVAFAFASADLVFEVTSDGKIRYAAGAASSFASTTAENLVGTAWLNLFSERDQRLLDSMVRKLKNNERCGPMVAELNEDQRGVKKAFFNARRLPGDEEILYCTLAQVRASAIRAVMGQIGIKSRLNDGSTSFDQKAQESLQIAAELDQDIALTMIELGETQDFVDRIGADHLPDFMGAVTDVLRSHSFDGEACGDLGDGKFGVVHESGLEGSDISGQIAELARSVDPDGKGLAVQSNTLELKDEGLSPQEAAKALAFAIQKFARTSEAGAFSVPSLKDALTESTRETATRISSIKSVIANNRFRFVFQPIVDLRTCLPHHFEILARLDDGTSPFEFVTFAESMGMIMDFDLAICRRAIDYLLREASTAPPPLAVNLSGQSLENDLFVSAFLKLLCNHKDFGQQLMFEVTESTEILDLESVGEVVKSIQEAGFSVCLDDFGAGAASFQYLHALPVDYVKIDGAYVQRILDSERDLILLSNLTRLCCDLNIKTIGEMIETEGQFEKLKEIGVDMGQGFLFGKPAGRPVTKRGTPEAIPEISAAI